MKIARALTELVGNTPLLALKRFAPEGRLLAKVEGFNPLSSSKDRAALAMVEAAEKDGSLRPGAVIVEATSGNTGIALAWIAALRGYEAVLTLPEGVSEERKRLLTALGARLVLTPKEAGMAGAEEEARALAKALPGAWRPAQFENPANAGAHFRTTGPEIWRDTGGGVEVFVACVGSGGTLTGAGRYLKSQNPAIRVAAVEPAESPLLSEGWAAPHAIQGIGPNFLPPLLDRAVYDAVVPVSTAEARAAARALLRTEGLFCGISSGAAAAAAKKLCQTSEYAGRTTVVLLPDTGERYLSTDLYE